MNTNLDQGEVLKDASAGPSMQEVAVDESGEQPFLSIHTSEIIQVVESFCIFIDHKYYYRNCIIYMFDLMTIDEQHNGK